MFWAFRIQNYCWGLNSWGAHEKGVLNSMDNEGRKEDEEDDEEDEFVWFSESQKGGLHSSFDMLLLLLLLVLWKHESWDLELCSPNKIVKDLPEMMKIIIIIILKATLWIINFTTHMPLTHTSTLAKLMQTTNTIALVKFVACSQYQRTINLFSMIYLSSNGLFSPKGM